MRLLTALPRIAALLGTLSLSRTYADIPVIRRLLSGITVVIALTIISGMLVGSLLVSGLYVSYAVQVYYGIAPVVASAITAAIAAILTLVVVSATIMYARNLAELPKHLFKAESPLTYRASSIANAFVDGLLTREIHRGG